MLKRVILSNKGYPFIKKGQLWMYRNNLISAEEGIEDGDIVKIVSEDGEYLATGFYSAVSHIAVRIVSREEKEEINSDYFRKQMEKACNYRKEVLKEAWDNCRLIYGEADGIPGLIVDRYNDVLVSQVSCKSIELRKEELYSVLTEILQKNGQIIHSVYERNDIKVREKEGLPLYKGYFCGAKESTETIISENGIKIRVDYEKGQKTGYFLDQKLNRKWVQDFSKGLRVLDCFSHTGGFALNAAKGNAKSVVAVDVSRTALDQGFANACMNQLEDTITFVQDDVFHYLDTLKEGDFDLIILDPPAFTKSRRTIDHAYKGYKEINQKAMHVLKRGSYLASCSCSRYMEADLFYQMLLDAAKEENVSLKPVTLQYQSPDHPILETMKETEYLKFYVFEIIK